MVANGQEKVGSVTQVEYARQIASHFDLPEPLKASDYPGKGNINQQTYLITAGTKGDSEYLLQQLNPGVFTQPQAVMNAMISCIDAQQKALSAGFLKEDEWETICLVPTKEGRSYLDIWNGSDQECWRMMVRIRNVLSYRSLLEIPDSNMRLQVAEQAGKGLALFGALTSAMDPASVVCPLPGYRDTELYYNQLLSVLAESRSASQTEKYLPADPVVRSSTEKHFLVRLDPAEYRRRLSDSELRPYMDFALNQRPFGLTLFQKLQSGELKMRIVHGDTKLDNFLFSSHTGKVKALVDLDTIMPHTWLSDWGDMVRSLVNIAGERERNLENVDVDERVFRALAKGFLGSAPHANPSEIKLMADAPQIMALELGVRFLADYLRGDTYFKLKQGEPADLNKTRAIVQFRVFECLRSKCDSARQIVQSLSA
jgi:hypothetical protein